MNEFMRKVKGNGTSLPPGHARLYDGKSGLYVEEIFHDFLNIERKRAERSHRNFLLMLLHLSDAACDEEERKVLEKITCRIISLTRETDIRGWYRQGKVLGIIFTETNGTGKELLREKIEDKLCEVMKDHEDAGQIHISLHVFPEEKDVWHDSGPSDGKCDLTFYTDLSRKDETRRISLIAKRLLDIIGSILGIILFSPFFLIIPLCIKLTSRGPVFFRQERIGQYGKRFTFLKFRSMQAGCDANIHKAYVEKLICRQSSYKSGSGDEKNNGGGRGDARVYKICDDPRVTPVGKFIRKTSLDELPQFFNVLKGDMALVGPRPPIPYEVENYDVWHRRRIFEVKPGITGLWQVKGRSTTSFDEMVRLDLQYSREWSVWLDLKIIFETPLILLIGKGAY